MTLHIGIAIYICLPIIHRSFRGQEVNPNGVGKNLRNVNKAELGSPGDLACDYLDNCVYSRLRQKRVLFDHYVY